MEAFAKNPDFKKFCKILAVIDFTEKNVHELLKLQKIRK